MEQYLEKIILSINRIESLNSLMRVFDLIHFHYSTKSVPQYFQNLDEVYKAQGDLYLIIMSYLFSLFDSKGINIIELSKARISDSAKGELEKITEVWHTLCKPVTRIRHNLGFHGGNERQTINGIKALDEIDKNQLIPNTVVLIQMLSSFSMTLKNEINYKT
jgi:hypothetical protein